MDWLLVETLGEQPMVVATGQTVTDFVPLDAFLRRSPYLAAIQTAIAETVASGTGLASLTPKSKRVIRTEPVQLTDGRIQAVHLWCGPTDEEPPDRPIPGALKWDFTTGEGSVTSEYLANTGRSPGSPVPADHAAPEAVSGNVPVITWAGSIEADQTYCATWEFIDDSGQPRRIGWFARTRMETDEEDGKEHLVGRAMNIVESVLEHPSETVATGADTPDEHRIIIDQDTWRLLKWVYRPGESSPRHGRTKPNHEVTQQLPGAADAEQAPTVITGLLRFPDQAGGWVSSGVRISDAVMADGTVAGLAAMRLIAETATATDVVDVAAP